MDYTRRNITLPTDLNERLKNEGNASATIAEALELLFNHKSTVKGLAKLVADFEGRAEDIDKRLESIQRKVSQVAERAGV